MLEMPRAAFIAALEDHPEDFVLETVGMGHAVRCLHCFHASTSKTDASSWFMDYPFLRNLYQNDLVKPRSNATHSGAGAFPKDRTPAWSCGGQCLCCHSGPDPQVSLQEHKAPFLVEEPQTNSFTQCLK